MSSGHPKECTGGGRGPMEEVNFQKFTAALKSYAENTYFQHLDQRQGSPRHRQKLSNMPGYCGGMERPCGSMGGSCGGMKGSCGAFIGIPPSASQPRPRLRMVRSLHQMMLQFTVVVVAELPRGFGRRRVTPVVKSH